MESYTLEALAAAVSGGNLVTMAKLANDAGAGLDENEPDPAAEVNKAVVVDLYAMRASDRVGRKLAELLGRG